MSAALGVVDVIRDVGRDDDDDALTGVREDSGTTRMIIGESMSLDKSTEE